MRALAAFGEGICDAYAGTAAHNEADGIEACEHASCRTPTIPVGPSYRERCRSNLSIVGWSFAVPMIRTSREWGTSASNAPRDNTIEASKRAATLTICSVNKRHFKLGSGPRIRMTSAPGVLACHRLTFGHTMLRVTPLSKRTDGRIVAKSVNSSGSISARGSAFHASIRVRTAVLEASAASFQPLNAAMTAGLRSVGCDNQRT